MRKNLLTISLTTAITLITFIYVGCKKDSSSPTANFKYSGQFDGTISTSTGTSPTTGLMTIDVNNNVSVDLDGGSLKGTAQGTSNGYTLTFTEGQGMFLDLSSVTGSVDTASNNSTINGTNPGGTPLTIAGNIWVTSEAYPGFDTLKKSIVHFTHTDFMLASVTVNGVTFSGLNTHYAENGLCNAIYTWSDNIRRNVDTFSSKIFCHDVTIKGLNGQPVTFTDCNTIRYVLDKNKKYDYTALWQDGTTTTGSFTTKDAGYSLSVCLKSGSSSGGNTGNCNNPVNKFKIGGTTSTVAQVDCETDPDGYIISAEGTDGNEIEVILPSFPTANRVYQVVNGATTTTLQPFQAVIYAYNDQSEVEYLSTGGGLRMTFVNGKVQVDFCDVSVKDIDGGGMTKVSGKLSCQ
jgi:hypothetical protein